MPSSSLVDQIGLFDTLVPLASIATIFGVMGFFLSKHESSVAFFLLVWWTSSVIISLNGSLFSHPDRWSDGDGYGILWIVVFMVGFISTLLLWIQRSHRLRLFLCKRVPLVGWIVIHTYRLDGLSILFPFLRGNVVPNLLGWQTIVLEVAIGAGSLPLAWWAYQGTFLSKPWKKDIFGLWNSIGLYDLFSAYVVLILNFLKLGGKHVTEPPLAFAGVHPLPLLILFQAPLGILTHIFLLYHLEEILDHQGIGGRLPLHIRQIRNR